MKRLIFLFVLVIAVLLAGWWGKLVLLGNPRAAAMVQLEIPAGSGVAEVARTLDQGHVIDHPFFYRLFAIVSSPARRAKPGPYLLRPGMSFREIAKTLALGPERKESSLTVIEGWTVDEIAELLHQEKGVLPEQTAKLIGRAADLAPFDTSLRSDFAFLKDLPKSRSLEGYLLPDTYRIWDDQLPDGLVKKQLEEFEDKFGSLRPGASSRPLASLDEVVILASIVEREVRHPEERRHVAGIFLHRLRIGMALQSDATLNYVTGSGRSQANAEDLALENLYNTYKHPGLPPGPISNPGAASLEAVLDPLETDDLFFLTDSKGTVFYAKTLEEHVENRQKAGY